MKRKGCRIALGLTAIIVLGLGIWIGPVLASVWRAGFFERIDREEYRATRTNNLKSIHTALTLHQDSEGAYPAANSWMDDIAPRLRTDGMSEAEAARKLVRPDLDGQDGKFGYSMNEKAAGQYVGDLAPDMVLVFESEATARNASSEPDLGEGRMGITVSGKIVGNGPDPSEAGSTQP